MVAPPSDDEIELSVFGPGVGEAVAIHLGGGEWMLVDSCVDSRTGKVATLHYLTSIGVNIADQVRWVVATHAHDDHIAGLSQVVADCVNATVILPEASSAEEFFALSKLDERLAFYETRWTIYGEYRRSMSHLELRNRCATLCWGSAGKEFPAGASLRGDRYKLLFLAPSDFAITRSKQVLGRLLQAATRENAGARVVPRDPNSFSAALVVQVDDVTVLLGGDVLVGASSWGWRHIAAAFPYEKTVTAYKGRSSRRTQCSLPRHLDQVVSGGLCLGCYALPSKGATSSRRRCEDEGVWTPCLADSRER